MDQAQCDVEWPSYNFTDGELDWASGDRGRIMKKIQFVLLSFFHNVKETIIRSFTLYFDVSII